MTSIVITHSRETMAPSKASSVRVNTSESFRSGEIVRVLVTRPAALGAEFEIVTQAISGAFYLNNR